MARQITKFIKGMDTGIENLYTRFSASGTISNNTWTSVLIVDHATFKKTFNPAPYMGEYNLQLPGSGTPAALSGLDNPSGSARS